MKLLAASTLLLLAPLAQAAPIGQIAPHVHGQATVDVAVDAGTVELALQAPGIGVLDFERPPASPAEQAALARAQSVLNSGTWIALPAAARCTLAEARATATGFDAAAQAGSATGHVHAGFSASLRYRCAAPAALHALEVRLPLLFPGLHEVIVNHATASGQGRSVVTAGMLHVSLDS
ncbi:DUF2796 domain-containing protein [Stenotrophomonas sp. 24(2023)]|uniref:ZrgA family zinc uptake protein n=1 Tax=Stenotrophomonas sp. 24(2023) TaxID=3068324 RepID=UPI0027DEF118|nr:DUF2796 domain-containing protein [Stenotrophomonas sp. 24(2023)]WMJ69330.1 DUF2796 domain-containing protein [Stenotrophomonas sp. 24(2023)]